MTEISTKGERAGGRMTAREMAWASMFAVLSAVGSHINIPIPFSPVPMTLQTAFVLGSGIMLGPRLGALSMALYMVMGLLGLPVFASGGGLGALLSPTFGFVIGFIPASWAAGAIARRASGLGGARLLAMRVLGAAVGMAIYDVVGVAWLWSILNYVVARDVSLGSAIAMGFVPFVIPDLLKIGVVAAMITAITSRFRPSR